MHSNRFRSPDQETAFQHWDLPDGRIRMRALAAVSAVSSLAFVHSDYLLFGTESPFGWLLALRISFAIASIVLFLAIPRIERPEHFDLVTGGLTVGLVTLALVSNWTRPPDYLMHIAIDVLIVIAIYAFIPNRWTIALVAGLGFSIGNAALLHLARTPADPIAMNAVHFSLVAANAVGFLMWRSFQISRRVTFQALTQEVSLRESLERSLAEVKVLRGIVPICAQCKCIRDDLGFWHQVEVYFKDRTDVDFSHGLCPPCVADFERDI